MIKFIKKLFPYSFKRSVKDHLGVPSLHWSLQNLKKKGFNPKNVIDIGAYEGHWTIDFLEVFPDANILMVEAQLTKEHKLKEVTNRYAGVNVAIEVLSSLNNVLVEFFENETASHINTVSSENEMVNSVNQRKAKSLDTLLLERNLPMPDFLKLDVQGHEIEVLKGGGKALFNATFCLLEVTLIDLGDNAPLFFEVNKFMDEKGFQVYDICQFMRRPFDKALYQLDVLFIKKDSSFVNDKNW